MEFPAGTMAFPARALPPGRKTLAKTARVQNLSCKLRANPKSGVGTARKGNWPRAPGISVEGCLGFRQVLGQCKGEAGMPRFGA
jgi:hypothetical protein